MPEVLEGTAFTSVTLVRKKSSASSTFNVQVSALQLKSVRAAFNYIKENQCLSVVKKNSYRGDSYTRDKRNPSVSSTFNVQVSALQLKIIRATFNHKESR